MSQINCSLIVSQSDYGFKNLNSTNEKYICADFFSKTVNKDYMAMGDIKSERIDRNLKWTGNIKNEILFEMENETKNTCYIEIFNKKTSEIVGLLILGIDKKRSYAELYDMVIRNGYRGKGIGEIAIEWLFMTLKQCGYKRILLESGAHNDNAHKFFEKNGFKPLAVEYIKEL